MSNFLLAILLVLAFLTGCTEKTNSPVIQKRIKPVPNKFIIASDSGLRLKQDNVYLFNHKFSGHIYALYPNGDSSLSGSYLNGKEEGVFKKWYPNGQLIEIRVYIDGKKEGLHQGWWENGLRKFEYHFQNAEHQGELKEWSKTGQPYRFFHYQMGYEEGSQKMWWENGSIRANYVVRNGKKYGLIGLKICVNPYDSIVKK